MVCVDEEGWLRVDEPQLMELAARGGGGKGRVVWSTGKGDEQGDECGRREVIGEGGVVDGV